MSVTVAPASPVPATAGEGSLVKPPGVVIVPVGASVSTVTEPVAVTVVEFPAASRAVIDKSAVPFVSPDCTE